MSFLNPEAFFAIIIPVALIAIYIWRRKKNSNAALRLSSAELLGSVVPKVPWYKLHLAAILFIIAFLPLVVALARPIQEREVATDRALVILALDTSLSMMADDVDPTRFDAARTAAIEFLEDIPENIDVALISFAGFASLEVSPTDNQGEVIRSLERLDLSEFTAVGEAVALAVRTAESTEGPDGPLPTRVIVLSDGETTQGLSEDDAIVIAREAEVPISTIAFGTPNGSVSIEDPFNPFGGSVETPVPVAEDNLRQIAEQTGGTFFTADSADELSQVYEDIGVGVDIEIEEVELTAIFAWIALALFTVAGSTSVLWSRRLP